MTPFENLILALGANAVKYVKTIEYICIYEKVGDLEFYLFGAIQIELNSCLGSQS